MLLLPVNTANNKHSWVQALLFVYWDEAYRIDQQCIPDFGEMGNVAKPP